MDWGYSRRQGECLCGGEEGECWVGDGGCWFDAMVLVGLWEGREMGEAVCARRGVVEGMVEFGRWVERRAKGERWRWKVRV